MESLIATGKATVMVAAGVLGFSRQAFYTWRAKPVSNRQAQDEEIIAKIRLIHAEDPEFGYRFIADELCGQGVQISERRVWRLCSLARVFSVIARRKRCGKKTGALVHDDMLQRHFYADRANSVWVTDITEPWAGEGKLYLCAIKDLYSRKIVGYAMSSRMTSPLAVEALEDAMRKRGFPRGVVVHSDRGCQFASRKFRTALKAYGAKGSMGRVGACGDSAAMESFFVLVEKNVLDRRFWATRRQLSAGITYWIERTYHRKRCQRALGKLTPIEYETITEPAVPITA